jgi:WS/DGAT/MGAT family acyltransferase
MRRVAPLDAAWLLLESRDTPMHVGGLFEFTKPADSGPEFLVETLKGMREGRAAPPWSLKLVEGPVVGPRLPLMREEKDLDLEYHVRHSALPHPGGQRELGVLVSRLHGNQLDLHRPLWEMHLIEGLSDDRFAIYMKMHHSLIDGIAGMRMILRTLSADPEERGMGAFWTTGEGRRPERREEAGGDGNPFDAILSRALGGASTAIALGKAGVELGRASLDDGALSAPYNVPSSALGGHLGGQRRFATQQYDLSQLKALAAAADCTLNDMVLYLSSSALRRYLGEHGTIPDRSLTAGVPVNLRDPDDQSTGTAIGMLVVELGTNIADERERIEAIKASTTEAKRHQQELPPAARTPYTLLMNGPYIAGLMAGLGGSAPIPFNVGISNVPGPTETLYFNGARLDALFPLSLLTHGNGLNITCLSYAGTLNFGFTGARDSLPHLQRLAIYMGDSLEEITELLLPKGKGRPKGSGAAGNSKPAPPPKPAAEKP